MTNSITRRAMLIGATATALTVSTVANAGNHEATLASLIARHKAMHDAMTLEGHGVDALESQLLATEPHMPPELTTAIEIAGDKPLSPDGTSGWTLDTLDRYLTSAIYFKPTRIDRADGGFSLECVDVPLPPETLAHMRRVREARASYDAVIQAHSAPFETRRAAWEATLAKVDDALQDIIAFPATSWATLHQKTDYLRTIEALERRTDYETALDIANSLIADILALTANA
jgi:hypothetical protein